MAVEPAMAGQFAVAVVHFVLDPHLVSLAAAGVVVTAAQVAAMVVEPAVYRLLYKWLQNWPC
jgi:hypothetical protein